MRLVIDIPEEMYKRIVKAPRCASDVDAFKDRDMFVKAIRNGKPLPKGHGDLISRDALIKQFGVEDATKYGNETAEQQTYSYSTMMMYEIADVIDDAEVIIEADKEG